MNKTFKIEAPEAFGGHVHIGKGELADDGENIVATITFDNDEVGRAAATMFAMGRTSLSTQETYKRN